MIKKYLPNNKVLLEGLIIDLGMKSASHEKIDMKGCTFRDQEETFVTYSPPTSSYHEVVGFANLKIIRGVLVADIILEGDLKVDCFPAVGGKILDKVGDIIAKFELVEIALVDNNLDHNLKSIMTQCKEIHHLDGSIIKIKK